MSVRLVAHDHPETRDVFRRYGEEDDRPAFGHLEPLSRFAERRGVELSRLLEDLATVTGLAVDDHAVRDERLHRPFVLVALMVALTLGAGWGAHLLTQIGLREAFDTVLIAHVIAHGTAQLWGFVAVFVVGIALRYLPMAVTRPLPRAAVRRLLLYSLIVGVLTQFAWSLAPGELEVLGWTSGLALVVGATTYLVTTVRLAFFRLRKVWVRSVLMAAAWLSVWAWWTLLLQVGVDASGPSAYTATDRQIVMELSLFGFALGSVYGFGRKLLPGFLRAGGSRQALYEIAFWLHNIGLIVLVTGRKIDNAIAIAVGLVSIAIGGIVYVRALGGLRSRAPSAQPEKGHPILRRYIQLAFVWLIISVLGLAVISLIEGPGATQVPHAIHGAVRHALTVGFLVTLILGVGQRLLPILTHTLLAWPRLVVPTLVLIGVGNLVRVASEAATPWWPAAFTVMPFSSVLELAALALFTANVIRTMWPVPDPLVRTGQISRESRMATLLSRHPWIEDELIGWGMDYVKRVRQVPAELTVATFAMAAQHDPDETVMRINAVLRSR